MLYFRDCCGKHSAASSPGISVVVRSAATSTAPSLRATATSALGKFVNTTSQPRWSCWPRRRCATQNSVDLAIRNPRGTRHRCSAAAPMASVLLQGLFLHWSNVETRQGCTNLGRPCQEWLGCCLGRSLDTILRSRPPPPFPLQPQ